MEKGEGGFSEPDALATVATLRRRIQLFIAYLYKPEAQAKVASNACLLFTHYSFAYASGL